MSSVIILDSSDDEEKPNKKTTANKMISKVKKTIIVQKTGTSNQANNQIRLKSVNKPMLKLPPSAYNFAPTSVKQLMKAKNLPQIVPNKNTKQSPFTSRNSINGSTTALNQSTTPLNQSTTPLNQSTTASNQRTTALNQRTTALNQSTTALNQTTTPLNKSTTASNQRTTALNQRTTALNQSTAPLNQSTAPLNQRTTALNQSKTPLNQRTTALIQSTAPLNQRTTPLNQSTTALNQRTTALNQTTTASHQRTTVLNQRTTVLNQSATALNQSTTALNQSKTALIQSTAPLNQRTTALNQTTTASHQRTTVLNQSTAALNQSTTPLIQRTTALNQSTTALNQSTTASNQRTAPSNQRTTALNLNEKPKVITVNPSTGITSAYDKKKMMMISSSSGHQQPITTISSNNNNNKRIVILPGNQLSSINAANNNKRVVIIPGNNLSNKNKLVIGSASELANIRTNMNKKYVTTSEQQPITNTGGLITNNNKNNLLVVPVHPNNNINKNRMTIVPARPVSGIKLNINTSNNGNNNVIKQKLTTASLATVLASNINTPKNIPNTVINENRHQTINPLNKTIANCNLLKSVNSFVKLQSIKEPGKSANNSPQTNATPKKPNNLTANNNINKATIISTQVIPQLNTLKLKGQNIFKNGLTKPITKNKIIIEPPRSVMASLLLPVKRKFSETSIGNSDKTLASQQIKRIKPTTISSTVSPNLFTKPNQYITIDVDDDDNIDDVIELTTAADDKKQEKPTEIGLKIVPDTAPTVQTSDNNLSVPVAVVTPVLSVTTNNENTEEVQKVTEINLNDDTNKSEKIEENLNPSSEVSVIVTADESKKIDDPTTTPNLEITDEIEETPLTKSYEDFLKACRDADPTEDMAKLIDRKLLKYYQSVHPDFVNSKGFCRTVQATTKEIIKSPQLVYMKLKNVIEELKVRRNTRETVVSNEDQSSTGDEKRDDQVKVLSRGLYKLQLLIKKYENYPVDWENDSNSPYLKAERYKKRACEVYEKICDLTGESKHAHRTVSKPISFQGTAYPMFNKTIQTFVNRTKTFPDFLDILRLLEFCNKQNSLNLSPEDMKVIAIDAFTKVGKLLQERRKNDLYDTLTHFTGTEEDPAEIYPDLNARLNENIKLNTKISSILEKYAKRQEFDASEKLISKENDEIEEDAFTDIHNIILKKQSIKKGITNITEAHTQETPANTSKSIEEIRNTPSCSSSKDQTSINSVGNSVIHLNNANNLNDNTTKEIGTKNPTESMKLTNPNNNNNNIVKCGNMIIEPPTSVLIRAQTNNILTTMDTQKKGQNDHIVCEIVLSDDET